MKNKFTYENDVENKIEIIDEGGFLGIRMQNQGSRFYAGMTIKKEIAKELHKWLGEYLKE
jgi:hypothetical protein